MPGTSPTGGTSSRRRSCATRSSAGHWSRSPRGCSATSSSCAGTRSLPMRSRTSGFRARRWRHSSASRSRLGLGAFCVAGALSIAVLGQRDRRARDRHRHDPRLCDRPRVALQLAGDREHAHHHERAVRQPSRDHHAAADRVRPRHRRGRGGARGDRPAAHLRVGRPAGRGGQRRAGQGARRRVPASARPRRDDRGAGGRHAAALRTRRHPVRHRAAHDGEADHGGAWSARGIGLASVWLGLVLSAMFNLPPSFFIVSVSFVAWLGTVVWDRRRGSHLSAHDQPVDRHHPAHASVVA